MNVFFRYPKPGRTNPFVNVYVANVGRSAAARRSPAPILLEPPVYFDDKERIIYAVQWASAVEVALTWENRHQNYSIVSICDVTLAACRDSLVMTEPREESHQEANDGMRIIRTPLTILSGVANGGLFPLSQRLDGTGTGSHLHK